MGDQVSLLTGQTAIVTGGAQGLGFAIAERFIAEGARVVLGDLDLSATAAAAKRLGGDDVALAVRCDVTAADEVEGLVASAVERFGGLDIMVNNAGITRDATMRKMTEEQFDQVISVHLKGTWNGTRTAASIMRENKRGQNDAASVCIVTTPGKADDLGLTPLVRLVSWGSAGVAPNIMGIGPVPATAAAIAKAGLALSDIDLIELNEAFAAQALAVMREWKFGAADHDRTNVHGSGISLGHPVGATGARILATLARELNRRDARYGLETMCIGGGQGLAAVFERVGT